MPLIERDVILQGKDEHGNQTMDFPVTRLDLIEDTAEVKAAPGDGDYVPVIDMANGGQMKKTPAGALGGAPQYDDKVAYAIGDYCNHDGKLYRCTAAIPAGGEAWDEAHWLATTVVDEIRTVSTDVKTIAVNAAAAAAVAQNTANQALTAAGAAQADATQALEQLQEALGGSLPGAKLENNSPEIIQAVAKAGLGPMFWSVGDRVPIRLNGTVGNLTFYDEEYYAYIIGFNHNLDVEGVGIHFQFGKVGTGKDICFIDGSYNSRGNSAAFRMNTTDTNSGGWNGSYMRKTICPAFLACLPSAWRNIIAACTKYTDNTGGGSDIASYVTATSDKIWLLAFWEVSGSHDLENSAEQNYQKQYAYYANGNSKVKYGYKSINKAEFWWLRSVYKGNATHFLYVNRVGGINLNNANYSMGFTPGFKVA